MRIAGALGPAPFPPSMTRTATKILCVDDIDDNLRLLRADLEDEGFVVETAHNGKAALESIERDPPAAVILDWMMPGLTGIETLRRIRETRPSAELPVIMATALSEVENVVEAFSEGANDYVTKPIEIEILIARLRAHLRIRELTEERNNLAKKKDEFLSIVSHDLKNPIGVILGFAQLLPRFIDPAALGQKPKEMLASIVRNAQAMVQMVDDYMDVEALESGKLQVDLVPIDLGAIVSDVVTSMRPDATIKRIEIDTLLRGDAAWAMGDANRMRQVVANLVGNAVKFSPYDTRVSVELATVGRGVTLRVQDEGPGLTEADRKQLFGKYQRLSARPTAGEKSTGLGLYVCRMIVEMIGGTIEAELRGPSKGAAFVVCLPTPEIHRQDPPSTDRNSI